MRITTAILISTVFAGAALAQDKAQQSQIDARQGYFSMLGANMGTLAAMAKGELDYDEAAAATAGSNIETLSSYDLAVHFIAGTSSSDVDGTEAKAAIWEDMDGFAAAYEKLASAAAGMGDAVKGGQGNVGAALGAVGGACKGCHDTYRD